MRIERRICLVKKVIYLRPTEGEDTETDLFRPAGLEEGSLREEGGQWQSDEPILEIRDDDVQDEDVSVLPHLEGRKDEDGRWEGEKVRSKEGKEQREGGMKRR